MCCHRPNRSSEQVSDLGQDGMDLGPGVIVALEGIHDEIGPSPAFLPPSAWRSGTGRTSIRDPVRCNDHHIRPNRHHRTRRSRTPGASNGVLPMAAGTGPSAISAASDGASSGRSTSTISNCGGGKSSRHAGVNAAGSRRRSPLEGYTPAPIHTEGAIVQPGWRGGGLRCRWTPGPPAFVRRNNEAKCPQASEQRL
jgi:hypothetical protein